MREVVKIVTAVDVVEQVVAEALKRVPPTKLPGITFYSELDVWLFHAVMDNKTCDLCRKYEDAGEWRGDQLRLEFPYHEIGDENTIRANVHPNCRCYLSRMLKRE